jgi:uroporphyrinogen III methyltransferase / synthase
MSNTPTNQQGIERTILLSPRLPEFAGLLHEFNVMTWPELSIQPPPSAATLDEAIENIFGYDWVVFVNADAVRFFLERLIEQGHDVSKLDSLRVCAIGEATAAALSESQVHVDVIATNATATGIVEDIADYAGGVEFLQRLNFLLPQAAIGRDYLKPQLEAADARADVVLAYQTVSSHDATRLSVLQSLLLTGSIDAVAFAHENDVYDLLRLFDVNDLGRLLRDVPVVLCDEQAATIAEQTGIAASVISQSSSQNEMIEALLTRFAI